MVLITLPVFSQERDSLKDFKNFYKEKTSFQDFIEDFNKNFKFEIKKSKELQKIKEKVGLDINSIEALLLIYANSDILKLSILDKQNIIDFLLNFSSIMLVKEKAFTLVLNQNKSKVDILAVPEKYTGKIKNLYILQLEENMFLKSDELDGLLVKINTATKILLSK